MSSPFCFSLSVLSPPGTSARLVWCSTRSSSLLTAGRSQGPSWSMTYMVFVELPPSAVPANTPVGCLFREGFVLSKERNGSFNSAVGSLWQCIRPKIPPSQPKPLLVCTLVGLVHSCSDKHWTYSASCQQHKSFQFWTIHSRKKKGIKSWSSRFWLYSLLYFYVVLIQLGNC